MRIKRKHWQIIWEVLVYLIDGILLILYCVKPSFKYVTMILVTQYVVGILNTVFWWKWLNAVDSHATQNKINPNSPNQRTEGNEI